MADAPPSPSMSPTIDTETIISEFNDPERKRLIEAIVDQDPGLSEVFRSNSLALWFGRIETLRELAHKDTRANSDDKYDWISDQVRYTRLALSPQYDVPGALTGQKLFPKANQPSILGKRRAEADDDQDNGEDVETDTRAKRENSIRNLVLARDKEHCALTKHGRTALHVGHILPFKLHKGMDRGEVWRYLEFFWGVDQTNEWKSAILGKDGKFNTEQLHNMCTLAPHLHRYWDLSIAALRPISMNESKTSMEISFHWLPLPDSKLKRSSLIPLASHPYPDPKFLDQLRYSPGENIVIFDNKTMAPIQSGTIFTMETEDPDTTPLPSFELLNLRWHLARIISMQGAGEEESDDDDDESDNDAASVSISLNSHKSCDSEIYLHPLPYRYDTARSRSRSRSSHSFLSIPGNISHTHSAIRSRSPSTKSENIVPGHPAIRSTSPSARSEEFSEVA